MPSERREVVPPSRDLDHCEYWGLKQMVRVPTLRLREGAAPALLEEDFASNSPQTAHRSLTSTDY